jgi:hypothetical protein
MSFLEAAGLLRGDADTAQLIGSVAATGSQYSPRRSDGQQERTTKSIWSIVMGRLFILTIWAVLLAATTCKAGTIYDISLDTSSLIGNANAPFALDFQLTSGDTTSGVVNTAILSLFTFGASGSAGLGSPFPNSGNASGDLGSTVTLDTSGATFFNEFSQYFAPGSMLAFQLDLTNTPQSSGTPDEFTFQLIDNTLAEIPTTDPTGSGSLAIIDLTGGTLQPEIFTTNGDGVTIQPQVSSPASGSSPEPSTAWLVAPVLLVALWYQARRSRHP